MGKKLNKDGKRQVTRLFDLEVDEVSLVDQPAIGESFIVTKSVNGKGDNLGKKIATSTEGTPAGSVTKSTSDPAPAAAPAPAASVAPVADPAPTPVPASDPAPADPAPAEAEPAVDPAAPPAPGEADPSSEPEVEGEPEGEPEADGVEKRVAGLEKQEGELQKNVTELQQALAGMLELHDVAATAMNMMVSMTAGMLEMVVGLGEQQMMAAEIDAESELGKSMLVIKSKVAELKPEVQKAGAKISASRLAVLQEIATKLADLLTSVAGEAAKAKKEKSAGVEALQKSFGEQALLVAELQKALTTANDDVKKMANRLDDLEGASSPSSEVDEDGEDGEDNPSSTQPKSKSVFAGLIPVDEIRERTKNRQQFLSRKKT